MSDVEADVIVVGAGSAGCVVAGRLAAAGASVVLVESGPHRRGDPAIDDPARPHDLWHSPLDWDYYTVPQKHAHDRRLHLPRGRVVGGSHALNGMIWVRGNPADYDHWAYLGNAGWAWEQVRPVFERAEERIEILAGYEPDPVHVAMVAAAQEAGLPFNGDYNDGIQDGVSFLQFTIAADRRRTTAEAYLGPEVRLIPDASVRRLLFSRGRCTGVEWSSGGAVSQARAGLEVVVCAGAIGSPELLMRSGIGGAAELEALGIAVEADLPGVGRNLQDHWLVPVIAVADRPIPPPKGLPVMQAHLFWRSRPDLLVPDLQPLHFGVPLYEPWMEGPADGVSLMAGLIRPASRGTVRLAAADGPPLIDPRVLSRQVDVEGLAAAVRLCQEITEAPALRDGWGVREIYPKTLAATAEGLHAYIRETVITYHHPAGTCKMGVDEDAVVDPELRVHGVAGLRVADASIMPVVTTGNTNAPAIMIGERAADLIAAASGLASPA
jgi:choline dehydrogenase